MDGYTTGVLRSLVESYTRLNNPKVPPLATVPENGMATASVVTPDANGGGKEKEKDSESVFDLSRQCYRHMLQYEYCRTVGRGRAADPSAGTQSSTDATLAAEAGRAADTSDGVVGTSTDNGSGGVKEREDNVSGPPMALSTIELPPQRVLCLDRALLEVEGGLHLPVDSNDIASSAHSNTPFPSSPVLFYNPKPHYSDNKKTTKANKATKRKSAALEDVSVEPGAVLGVNNLQLRLKPCEFKDLMFKKYKADTLRKQG